MKNKALMNHCKAVLYARRNGNMKGEQTALDKLRTYCDKRDINAYDALDQAIVYLKQHSIAAHMNAIV
jgi:hypothetical protein